MDVMIAIEHGLAFLLLFVFPIWDVFETRALKRSTDPRRKVAAYQRIVVVLWISAIAAWAT